MKAMTRWMMLAAFFAGTAMAEDTDSVPDVSLEQVSFGSVVNEVPFEKGDLDGKVVVVERWGTKCPPCIAFLPELAKIHKRYKKKGLEVVGMEVQGSAKEDINELLKKSRVNYPVVKGGRVPVNSRGIPHASVFGADGKLIWAGNPHEDEFVDSIKDALKAAKDMPQEEEAEVESGPLVEMREWTNAEGAKIQAEVISATGDELVFRMKNGKEVRYEVDKLSEEDQELIRGKMAEQ